MKEVKYEIIDEQQPIFKSILRPNRRPYLAVFDFSIVFGIICALLVGLFTLMAMNGKARLITDYFETIFPGYSIPPSPEALDALINLGIGLIFGFAYGYLFGLLVSVIYNRLRGPVLCDVRLQKDIPEREPVVLVEKGNTSSKARHSDSYTVVILANTFLEAERGSPKFREDEILDEPKLFKAKVECIIDSLRQSEILRKFISDMRFVAIIDPQKAKTNDRDEQRARALCLENSIDVIIEPRQRIYKRKEDGTYELQEERLKKYLELYPSLGRVDIVYAVTASRTHTRSSAYYTIEEETTASEDFQFILYNKDGSLRDPLLGRYAPPRNVPEFVPGLIAYSAWDNRRKTPLHEFAHAMSSTTNGLIYDEYNDEVPFNTDSLMVINKRRATAVMDDDGNDFIEPSELPELFAKFYEAGQPERNDFSTDRLRQKPFDWSSFVPDKDRPDEPCTMDRSGDFHRFDMLIEYFMEQRLKAKI